MSKVKVLFKIEEIEKGQDYFKDTWHFRGGLAIKTNNLFLTKRIDATSGDFKGDYVFSNMLDWINAIPKLLNGETILCKLIDYNNAFLFTPEKDSVYFAYRTLGTGQLVEHENRRYPGEGKGIQLPLGDLIVEIISTGKYLLKKIIEINPNLDKSTEVVEYKKAIEKAEKAYLEYLKKKK